MKASLHLLFCTNHEGAAAQHICDVSPCVAVSLCASCFVSHRHAAPFSFLLSQLADLEHSLEDYLYLPELSSALPRSLLVRVSTALDQISSARSGEHRRAGLETLLRQNKSVEFECFVRAGGREDLRDLCVLPRVESTLVLYNLCTHSDFRLHLPASATQTAGDLRISPRNGSAIRIMDAFYVLAGDPSGSVFKVKFPHFSPSVEKLCSLVIPVWGSVLCSVLGKAVFSLCGRRHGDESAWASQMYVLHEDRWELLPCPQAAVQSEGSVSAVVMNERYIYLISTTVSRFAEDENEDMAADDDYEDASDAVRVKEEHRLSLARMDALDPDSGWERLLLRGTDSVPSCMDALGTFQVAPVLLLKSCDRAYVVVEIASGIAKTTVRDKREEAEFGYLDWPKFVSFNKGRIESHMYRGEPRRVVRDGLKLYKFSD